MVQHENLPPFSPNDSIYLHEQFNREHLHPHAVSNFPTFNEKPFIHFSFFTKNFDHGSRDEVKGPKYLF